MNAGSSTLSEWQGVTTRAVEAGERPYPSGETFLPVVIEAKRFRDVRTLREFLVTHSRALKETMYEHGAILLRGFDVQRDEDFEGIVTSFDAAQPMCGYFMSEAGRDKIAGTRAVFNTNSFYKTGGGLHLGGFHSENFYSTDVPAVQSFWCKEPPSLGGETALVQSTHMYAELPDALKRKLEGERVLAGTLPLSIIAGRYQLPVDTVKAFCLEAGLEMTGDSVLVHKPAVYKHSHTGRLALQINFSSEIKGLDAALRRLIAPSYRGLQWALPRLGWRYPAVAALLPALDSWRLALQVLVGGVAAVASRMFGKRATANGLAPSSGRIAERLTPEDVETLAAAIWRHTSVFTWKKDDVLIFDNLQLLHAGMPGRGRREIRVMMCDPIRMDLPLASGLFEAPKTNPAYESMGTRLERLAEASPAQ
ncbi:TauD/TfdA family dioxygenase [Pendulispora brunnea]|uniref:TauD/TfdA family dioxygenase n=1 Tax=Pendulispora brunnea TaxID=2905690 RepID=A0ABZ2JY58_9BACT